MTGERRRFDCVDEGQLEEGLAAAVEEVRANRLVVLPTDTVYGIAADAFQAPAVRRLLRAKGRGRNMPPPVLISAAATLDSLASGVPAYAREMVEELWPGPLTLICTQQPSLKWDLGDNRATVAVRVPDHPVAVALLERTGPLAVSSANRTGMPAATTVDEAEEMLGDRVKVYLDAGPSRSGEASTILDVTGPRPRVLRRGGVSLARLREFDVRTFDAVTTPASRGADGDGGTGGAGAGGGAGGAADGGGGGPDSDRADGIADGTADGTDEGTDHGDIDEGQHAGLDMSGGAEGYDGTADEGTGGTDAGTDDGTDHGDIDEGQHAGLDMSGGAEGDDDPLVDGTDQGTGDGSGDVSGDGTGDGSSDLPDDGPGRAG